jgi:putative transposase
MRAAEELAPVVGIAQACRALAVSRASFYREQDPARGERIARTPAPSERALSIQERSEMLDALHAPQFVDKAPAEIYAALLDEGRYICSVRTIYRILSQEKEVRERRNQLRHPAYKKPELLATRPNQVWSWDITKLLGPAKWTYFYLYVILDIFSRYVVGWLLASCENADLARRLIQETIQKQGVDRDQLTIHSDRGPSMKSHTVAQLLATLGVTKSQSRPHVSNDNPFSESHFKTLKYRPDFPDRFSSQDDALRFCRKFVHWYNHDHYHTGIGLLTPAMVHYGQAPQVLATRQLVLDAAYLAHPERFVHKRPSPPALPDKVWINPPRLEVTQQLVTEPKTAVIETKPSFEAYKSEFDLTIPLLTSAEDPGRLLIPFDFDSSLNKHPSHHPTRVEATELSQTTISGRPQTNYTNSRLQVSQSR